MTIEELEEKLNSVNLYEFFRGEVEKIGATNFFKVYEYDVLHNYFIKNRPHDEYKMFVCLMENDFNNFIQSIKDNKDILENILKNNSLYYSIFGYCNIESLKIFLNELHNNSELRNCNYSFLTTIPSLVVEEYINNIDNIDDIALLVNYNFSIQKKFFCTNPKALDLINSGKVSVSHIINGGLKVSDEVLNSNKLFDELKDSNMINFRRNMDNVLQNNPSIILEEKLNKYEDELILNFDLENGLLSQYKNLSEEEYYNLIQSKIDKYLFNANGLYLSNNVSFDENLKILSQRKLFELIIDRLFKDNYYNVVININEILRYSSKFNESLVVSDHIDLYNKIINFKSLTCSEQIEIFKKYKDYNLNTKFYEDIRRCKDISYVRMINELYKPTDKDENLSNKYGVEIYSLDGQDFSMIIRGLGNSYRESTSLYRECFSLINQDNTSRVNSEYYYGYNDINYNNIIHVSENDAFSSNDEESTRKINRIMTSDEINSYKGLSEVQIKTDGMALKPNYIVAFNEISEEYIYNSKKLNIPIVLINEQKYNKKHLEKSNLFSEENNYVRNEFDEREYLRKHK